MVVDKNYWVRDQDITLLKIKQKDQPSEVEYLVHQTVISQLQQKNPHWEELKNSGCLRFFFLESYPLLSQLTRIQKPKGTLAFLHKHAKLEYPEWKGSIFAAILVKGYCG